MSYAFVQQPIQIGQKTARSRIVLPPMATGKAPDGRVTEALCEHYALRAQNPYVGMIITEHSYVSREGMAHLKQVSVCEDADIAHLHLLADTIHGLNNGVLLLMQISHAGGQASSAVTKTPVVGPSDAIKENETIRALTESEILKIEADFVSAAKRAQAAGFDGIELHGAHGYLLNQFFSPITNHRTDRYGCLSVGNRARIYTEIVDKIRQAADPAFLVAVRFGVADAPEVGARLEDCVRACEMIENAGADLLDISGGIGNYPHEETDVGYFRNAAKLVKAAVHIPVITTGGVTTIAQADSLIAQGDADMIGMGRALLKAPGLCE